MGDRMFWTDVETTGLNPATDRIIQAGFAITDLDLNVLESAEWYFWDKEISDIMEALPQDDYVRNMHMRTGLWNTCLEYGSTILQQQDIMGWLVDRGLSEFDPMCGSSVHFDRTFLRSNLPGVHDLFSYRNIDISTLKELAKRWMKTSTRTMSEDSSEADTSAQKLQKNMPEPKHLPIHLAQNDLLNTIDEAKWYRDHFIL